MYKLGYTTIKSNVWNVSNVCSRLFVCPISACSCMELETYGIPYMKEIITKRTRSTSSVFCQINQFKESPILRKIRKSLYTHAYFAVMSKANWTIRPVSQFKWVFCTNTIVVLSMTTAFDLCLFRGLCSALSSMFERKKNFGEKFE